MPNDTYKPSDGRQRVGSMIFDPELGKWVDSSNLPSVSVPTVTTPSTSNPNSEVDSKGEADREYIEQEYNTLEGDLAVIPNDKTIRIQTGDTVSLTGFGKVLSGKYYVSGVKRTITRDEGYSNSLTVMNNGFSDGFKIPSVETPRVEVVK